MRYSKEEIINYIEEKKKEREKIILNMLPDVQEMKFQNYIFLGVDMVIRWLNEME